MHRISSAKGISEKNRKLLTSLHRNARGPFTVREAMKLLSFNASRTQRFLAYLANRGWLSRVRRGLYATVPLDATEPARWREDPWVIATKIFSPSFYIGGWTACEHWGLTEQIFRETVVITTKKLRHHSVDVQGFPFQVKRVNERRIFGTQTVWKGQTKVQVSDPTHTIVDILDDPHIGGGIRHAVTILDNYLNGEHRDDALLVEYARRIGNRSIHKRLGYLLEVLQVTEPMLMKACKEGMSSGISLLDPSMSVRGRILRRWNIRLNATIAVKGGAD